MVHVSMGMDVAVGVLKKTIFLASSTFGHDIASSPDVVQHETVPLEQEVQSHVVRMEWALKALQLQLVYRNHTKGEIRG
jgi:hypothetical protein